MKVHLIAVAAYLPAGSSVLQPLIKPPDSLIESALLRKPLLRDAQVHPDGKPMDSSAVQVRLVDDPDLLQNGFGLTAFLWGKYLIRFCRL